MGAGLVVSLALVIGLVGLILVRGFSTFWPDSIERVELRPDAVGVPPGGAFLGIDIREEPFDPSETQRARMEALRASGELADSALASDGRPLRRQYRLGNLETLGDEENGSAAFPWIPVYEIAGASFPAEAVMLERESLGVWFGKLEALAIDEHLPADAPLQSPARVETAYGVGDATRSARVDADGEPFVLQRTIVPLEGDAAEAALERAREDALAAEARREHLEDVERVRVDRRVAAWERRLLRAEYQASLRDQSSREPLAWPIWAALLASGVGLASFGVRMTRSMREVVNAPIGQRIRLRLVWAGAALALLAAAWEHPWSEPGISDERLAEIRNEHAVAVGELLARAEAIDAEIARASIEDSRIRVIVRDPRTGRPAAESFAPDADPMRLSSVVRMVHSNTLDWSGRAGVYLDRWGEFLSAPPRSGTREGGVFPVIVGTVTLTLLLTIAVVPLGVIAALYLREYARQGPITSAIRIAVNNLAGVPSIVYGVFGLGFFCYTAGKYIDQGPEESFGRGTWWGLAVAVGLAIVLASSLAMMGRAAADRRDKSARRWGAAAGVCWLAVVVLIGLAVAGTPYFDGFYAARAEAGSPTFGTGGVLWAALTLALLTLPVVIVATEEAIAAVPNSLREGSYGTGASKWQTIRRIVLPGALPGVMTGAILAIARGAGEVAPLLLVGAVKLAPQLPVDGEAPFIHPERSFMHLGFHIYDLGSKSADSQAALPMVWTTTLLLIGVVLLLNLVAITIRSRLRSRHGAAL